MLKFSSTWGQRGDASAEIDGEKVPHFVGTPEYMSPEAVESKPATSASDVWALGKYAVSAKRRSSAIQGGEPVPDVSEHQSARLHSARLLF